MDAQRSTVVEALRRVYRQLHAFGATGRSSTELDIPAALGATDAELARLNRDLTRLSLVEAQRESALAIHAATALLR